MWTVLLAAFLLVMTSNVTLAESDDFEQPSIQRVPGITQQELASLLASDVPNQFERPSTLGFSPDDLNFWANRAKQLHRSAPVTKSDTNASYDIVIQIGHYPRKTGKTGGQGKYVTEQEMAALVAVGLVQKLATMKVNGKDIKAILIGADDYRQGLKSKIFLSLHTDASSTPCSVGPSVGYQKIGESQGMHSIALALALTLGLDAESFMKDNYTSNLSGYYAYRSFNTDRFKGLLEMSELTCPKQEEALLERAATLSGNLAVAVQFALR